MTGYSARLPPLLREGLKETSVTKIRSGWKGLVGGDLSQRPPRTIRRAGANKCQRLISGFGTAGAGKANRQQRTDKRRWSQSRIVRSGGSERTAGDRWDAATVAGLLMSIKAGALQQNTKAKRRATMLGRKLLKG